MPQPKLFATNITDLPIPATRNNTVLIRPSAETVMTQCALKVRLRSTVMALLLVVAAAAGAQTSQEAKSTADPVIWQDPGNIQSLNLFWGPGGEKHQPQPPFTFVEEDMHGTSPKFDVRDSNDKKWK